MRKLMVGLIAVGLLAVAAPAMAQTADSLGLIASGAVIPFVGNGQISPGSMSFIEAYSPVGANPGFHMLFFDATCVRGPESVGLPLTTNDVEILRVDNIGANPVEGLIAAATVDAQGFALQPLSFFAPVQLRMLWVNASQDFERVMEPISISNAEAISLNALWNPLRSAATFFAPLEVNGFHTTIYFICPTPSITSHSAKNGPAFPALGNGPFPALVPEPVPLTALFLRIYDDEENFLRNVENNCRCLTARSVTALNAVYADPTSAPHGTYTEVEFIDPATGNPVSGTGYRAMVAGGLDAFGRLSNGSQLAIQGNMLGGILQR